MEGKESDGRVDKELCVRCSTRVVARDCHGSVLGPVGIPSRGRVPRMALRFYRVLTKSLDENEVSRYFNYILVYSLVEYASSDAKIPHYFNELSKCISLS